MGVRRVVVNLELSKLPLQVTGIPEQDVVEKFSPDRPDQALYEWVEQRHVRHGLDFVDRQNPEICRPTVRLEYGIVIGTEMSRCALPVSRGVKHATQAGARDSRPQKE